MPRTAKLRSAEPSVLVKERRQHRTVHKALKDAGLSSTGFRRIVNNSDVAKAVVKAVERHVTKDVRAIRVEVKALMQKHGLANGDLLHILRLKK